MHSTIETKNTQINREIQMANKQMKRYLPLQVIRELHIKTPNRKSGNIKLWQEVGN